MPPRRNPGKPRLLRVGLASLYSRKANAQIKYLYRRVGKSQNERYSFRWQPQFTSPGTDKEYLKKRLFSWAVKRRSQIGELPPSTTSKNWPKAHRNNQAWRASHYFWSWRLRDAELRMDSETENTEEFIREISALYRKYMDQSNLPAKAQQAFMDLIAIINTVSKKQGEVNQKMVVRSSDGATARSKEEALIYLAPTLHKAKHLNEDRQMKAIAKSIEGSQNKRGRPQQLDVRGGTTEGKMLERFLKSRRDSIIPEGEAFSKSVFTKINAGADVTEKNLVARWGKELPNLDTKRIARLRAMPKAHKYAEYKSIIRDVRANIQNMSLGGEAQRRLQKGGEAHKKAYTFFIPTGAGDTIALKISGDPNKPSVIGGIIPDTMENMGMAAATHELGADFAARVRGVLATGGRMQNLKHDGDFYAWQMNTANQLLIDGPHINRRPFAPTYHVSIIPPKEFTARLSDLVEDAFGAYYQRRSWEDLFDPQAQYSNNNVFRKWASHWIQRSRELESTINKAATGDTQWMGWMKNKVKTKVSPYSWAHPVRIRPFLLTDKTGTSQYLASPTRMTPQGQFETAREGYLDNLRRL